MSQTVQLYVYDISNGLAKQLGQAFIGKQIEGIWHTGVVVYGKEYFYQGGITNSSPGKSMAGTPLKVIEMGETEIPYELFLEFLNDINAEYTEEKYNIISHNCNNFSNEVCEFLVGKKIPDWITGLPNDILSTPMGQMLLSSLQPMTNIPQPISSNIPANLPSNLISQNISQAPPNLNSSSQKNNQAFQSTSSEKGIHSHKNIIELKSILELDNIVDDNAAVISMFISTNIENFISNYQFFEDIALKNNAKQIKFCVLNILNCVQAKLKYGIKNVPYLLLFYRGQEYSSFQGANKERLTNDIQSLINLVNSEHQHTYINYLAFNPKNSELYTFESKSDPDKMLKDIEITLKKSQNKFPGLLRIVEERRTIIKEDKELTEINQLISDFELIETIGLLDLFRQSIPEISLNKEYSHNFFLIIWNTLIQKLNNSDFNMNTKKLGFAFRLILRCLCNLSKKWDQLIHQNELIDILEKFINIDDVIIIDHSIKLVNNLLIKASPEFLSIIRNRLAKIVIMKIDILKSNENELNCILNCLCKLFYLMEPAKIEELVKNTSLDAKLNELSNSFGKKNFVEDCKRIINI